MQLQVRNYNGNFTKSSLQLIFYRTVKAVRPNCQSQNKPQKYSPPYCCRRRRRRRDVRPTSQRPAVSPAALFTAAADCRRRRRLCRFFARRHIFCHHYRSPICNDDDRALQRTLSATHYCHALCGWPATRLYFDLNYRTAVAPPGGEGGGEASPPLWVDVQKLCNMCVLSLSWNFFVSHDKYIARPSSKEPRWHTDNTTGTGGLRTLDFLYTHTSLPPCHKILAAPLPSVLCNIGGLGEKKSLTRRSRLNVDKYQHEA